jgi:hypothetical protein
VELRELTPGLRRWTASHPAWKEGDDWEREVGCVVAETDEALVLIDPLVPDDGWDALDVLVDDADLPVATLLTIQWHGRSADAVRDRYPRWQHSRLPDGVVAHRLGTRSLNEALYWLPAYAALVPGDILIGDGAGGVRVAPASWYGDDEPQWYAEEMPGELAALLELPIELLLVSHGEPVLAGGRDALAAALR